MLIILDDSKVLILGDDYNLPLINISKNLEELYLGTDYDLPLDIKNTNIKILKIGNEFREDLILKDLDCLILYNIKKLIINNFFKLFFQKKFS